MSNRFVASFGGYGEHSAGVISTRTRHFLEVAPLALALFAWVVSLSRISPARIGELGLVSALPFSYFVAIGALCLGFALSLALDGRPAWRAAYVVALILVLHATLPVVYGLPRYAWAYKHIGVAAYIALHGEVNPLVDAYQNWPGFFALAALITQLVGLPDATALAVWAQPAFNLLYLGPLALVFSSVTQDKRRVWLALWIFYLTNWVGQDYFAPQAFGYLLQLLALGLCLRFLQARAGARGGLAGRFQAFTHLSQDTPPLRQGAPVHRGISAPRIAPVLALLVLFVVIVASHQLTPVMLIVELAALGTLGIRRAWVAMFVLAALTVAWDATFASTYMVGHDNWYRSLGTLFENLHFSTSSGAVGSSGHLIVAKFARGLTLVTWALAALGVARSARRGYWSPLIIALALAPFLLIVLGSYGGEMLLRIQFFSAPFMALLGSAALFPAPGSVYSRSSVASTTALGAILFGGFLFAYFGNEIGSRVTPAEVNAARFLYAVMPPGSMLVTTSLNSFPIELTGNYNQFEQATFGEEPVTGPPPLLGPANVEGLQAQLRREHRPAAYIVFSHGQDLYINRYGIYQPGSMERLRAAAIRTAGSALVYRNAEVQVYAVPNPDRQVFQ